MNPRASVFFAAVLAMLAACNNGEPCALDDDCFRGEVCLDDGFCGASENSSSAMNANNAMNSSSGTNSTTSNGTSNNTTSNNGGTGTNSATNSDSSTNNVVSAQCIVDPFDMCTDDEDEDNNDFPGQLVENETKGCQSFGFVPMDYVIEGRMCALDPEDLYSINVVECDDDEPGFIVEATLDVKSDCDPELIHFDVEQIGQSCAEPDLEDEQVLRCETLPDGRRRIQVLWPGQSRPVVGVIKFSVQTPERMDVQFDYDLHLVVREP